MANIENPMTTQPGSNSGLISIEEREALSIKGPIAILYSLVLFVVAALSALVAITGPIAVIVVTVITLPLALILLAGHFIVQPNQAVVLVFLGRYSGTVKEDGWHWANPLTKRFRVSQRIDNFQTETSKVNDADGNPIQIAAVVVWRVLDTAKASFAVEDYEHYVSVQSETAVRTLAAQFPYDDFSGQELISLRSHPDEIATALHAELQDRLDDAGVEVVEARLTHLAYATEIAEAMLRRQQASAVVAAKRTIVEGAVGMVEEALELLSERDVIELDDERKAQMVTNLLVVLTSESQTTPVLNAGTLY